MSIPAEDPYNDYDNDYDDDECDDEDSPEYPHPPVKREELGFFEDPHPDSPSLDLPWWEYR